MLRFPLINQDYEWITVLFVWNDETTGEKSVTIRRRDEADVELPEHHVKTAWKPLNERITRDELDKWGAYGIEQWIISSGEVIFGGPPGRVWPDGALKKR